MTGVPLGQHMGTGATVCGDPISWFTRAPYISNPSLSMLGMPGLGKSTLVNRMLIGLAATGVVPLVLGDLKPDYADTVRALGGQVISIGRGVGGNILDPGALDVVGRPLAVTADDWREEYAYDAAGNQTACSWPDKAPHSESRGERAYDGTRLRTAGGVSYTYDAAGRVTERRKKRLSRKPDVWRYTWDSEDRLTACTTPDGTLWTYAYDPLGRRIAKERRPPTGRSPNGRCSPGTDPASRNSRAVPTGSR